MNTSTEPKFIALYTTISSKIEAEKLAQLVLTEKLAACINIIPAGQSFYLWKGNIENNIEYYMLFKTLPEHAEALESFMLSHHPYDVPALLKWDVYTSPAFFNYLQSEIS